MIYFFITISVMLVAGIIGSYCRYFFDRNGGETDTNTDTNDSKYSNDNINKRGLFEIIVPSIVASFIIPIFLSIGKSLLLTNLLQGVDLYENILIVSFLGSKPSSSDEERLEPFFSHRLTPGHLEK
jgi:hypothetical protein